MRWVLIFAVIGIPYAARAQVLTGRDSAGLGRAIAVYILAHPDVPLGGALGQVVIDTTPGTITGSVGTAFRAIAPDRWLASGGAGDVVQLHFNIGIALFWGDSLTVDGSWSLCAAGASAGNLRADRYRAVRADSAWTIVRHEGWAIGRVVCGRRMPAR